jgi:hypothetical protein
MRRALIALVMLRLAVPALAQVKEMPTCPDGYEQKLVAHKFTCEKLKSVDDLLDGIEEAADDLIGHLKVVTALARDGQLWAEVDNDHPDAQKVRDLLPGKALELKIASAYYEAQRDELDKRDLSKAQEERYLSIVDEVTPLMQRCTRELRRYNATQ